MSIMNIFHKNGTQDFACRYHRCAVLASYPITNSDDYINVIMFNIINLVSKAVVRNFRTVAFSSNSLSSKICLICSEILDLLDAIIEIL